MPNITIRILAGACIVLYLLYRYVIYPAFISPLSKIPAAHWSARISPAWILWIRHAFRENRTIHAAHEKYGSVVRLGPNELSVNCIDDGVRTIYAGGFEKHQWYPNLFKNYDGVPNMFSTAESKPHSQRKRLMSNVYAKSSVQSSSGFAEACQSIVHDRLLPCVRLKLNKNASGVGSVDLYQVLNYSTMDIVTAYMFGLRSGSDFLRDHKLGDWWLGLYGSRKRYVFWPQELPRITDFLSTIGIRLSPTWVAEANHNLEDWCLEMCDKADRCCNMNGTGQRSADVPHVYQQLKNALGFDGAKKADIPPKALEAAEQTRLGIASDMLDHLSAGHETSAITLTYLFHEMILHQGLQQQLREELLSSAPTLRADVQLAPDEQSPLPSAKTLDNLPLLHAVVMETLRLHPAIPGSEPRITPSTIDGRGVNIGAFHGIPPNVRVSSQAYSLHRNSEVYSDPEVFDPDRWLTTDEKRKAEMQRWFWAFSSGGRMCIGSNLAMQQMKLITAVLIANFAFVKVLDDNPKEGGIQQEDAYTARPMGERLVVEVMST